MKAMHILTLACIFTQAISPTCDVSIDQKQDCGHVGTTQQICETSHCCWQPATSQGKTFLKPLKDTPWCFYPSRGPAPAEICNQTPKWTANSPGFTDSFLQKLKENFENNLNVENSGAVAASRDNRTPGGSYFFNWMRDAALSMKTYIEINDSDYNTIKDKLRAYHNWVSKVQNQTDPNNIDVRIEPKFTIPDGKPFTGGWCRPQTDGPALRALALSMWGQIL